MSTLRRRAVSITAVGCGAVLLTLTAPLWVPIAAVADLAMLRRRLPTVRLLAFATAWCWLEVCGVGAAGWLWVTRRRTDLAAHYALQRWWATRLMGTLRATTGITVEPSDAAILAPGPVIMLGRHASLADSLVSAWVITAGARMQPHYVLKRELLAVPNLDIVGNRLPNCFVDRQSADAEAELAKLRATAARLGADDVMVIFPEGTRSTPLKRERALAKIAERDPQRAARLSTLAHLLPPRPAGTLALLAGQPDADVVLAWHTGFDGWDSFGGIHRGVRRRPAPIRFEMTRIPRRELPRPEDLAQWLDAQWLDLDRRVGAMLDHQREEQRR